MTLTRLRAFMFATVAALAAVTLGAGQSAAEPTVLKYGWFGPPTEPTYAQSMAPFGEKVTADSNGTVKIEMYPGGSLGRDPSAQVKYLQDGVLDISYIIPSYTPGRFPDNAVFELPGLFRDATEATRVMWSLYEKGMLRGYEDLHVLQLAVTYPNLIHTADPVASLDDLDGLKLRVSGPTAGDAVRALSATPVGIPVTQGAEAITRGVLDGTVQDWNTYAAFRLADVAKHHLGVRMGQAPMLVAMTKERWDSLPDEAKAAFEKHAYEKLSLEVAALHDSITDKWRARVKDETGHVMTELDEEATASFNAAVEPVIQDWASKHDRGEELLKAVRAELEAIRSDQ